MPSGPYVLLGKTSKCKLLVVFLAGPANKTQPQAQPNSIWKEKSPREEVGGLARGVSTSLAQAI
jgi:hypothetical protein